MYYDLATGKLQYAVKNVERARFLEYEKMPVLGVTVNRLLEAYVHHQQSDPKSTLIALKDAYSLQGDSSRSPPKGLAGDKNWYLSVLSVLLYNLAVEHCSQFLLAGAKEFALRAEIVVRQVQGSPLEQKVRRLREALIPAETEEMEQRVESARGGFSFIPGGGVEEPTDKIVELTHETAQDSHRLTARRRHSRPSLRSVLGRHNPYLQENAAPARVRRFQSVQPRYRNG